MRRWIAQAALFALVAGLLAWLAWEWRRMPAPALRNTTGHAGLQGEAPWQQARSDNPTSAEAAAAAEAMLPPRIHPADARCERERRAQYIALYRATNPNVSPNHAALRALLARTLELPHQDRMAAQRELAEAVRRWPNNVELAWLAYEGCEADTDCDSQAALTHLQQVDGDNLFTWLPSLTAARQAGDNAAFADAMRRAAQASLYDPRWGAVVSRLRPALQSLPLPEVCLTSPGLRELAATTGRPVDVGLHADVHSLAVEFAVAVPAFSGVTHCWRSDARLAEGVVQDCRLVLEQLAEGETLLERAVGLPGSIRLAADTASREAWRTRYRELRWLQTFGAEIDRIDGFLWRTFAEGEVAVLERYARDTGRWPPPSQWLPADESGRKLLLNDNAP